MKTLELKTAYRSRNRKITFYDFVVSGKSLYSELCCRGFDYISSLGWLNGSYDDEVRARLLLKEKGNLPNGRVALYICPECADLGCGAITLTLSQDGNEIIWEEFGYENNYDEESYYPLRKLGPFRFSYAAYEATILSFPKREIPLPLR